ncbi:hypothetical protein FisN_2Lh119 [Fistulifera solaris]|uniref:Ketoreductase (KR) domain-containing protein n=1 Tax=Fistulifera solaris TaxID=1519565 RepID=A0A1Z5JWP6_FISSO|nr:hypothetical protein FisN_2Lh119 [Fistulifera solaris]|eukprot:GAX18465.1 hypothetical protein FisN_2Lh119 [Fistulifera solaris]
MCRRSLSALLCSFFLTHYSAEAFPTEKSFNARSQAKQLDAVATSIEPAYTYLLLGGTGHIGTAVAHHLLIRQPQSILHLVGRNAATGQCVLLDLKAQHPHAQIEFHAVVDIWKAQELQRMLELFSVDCVIHTAGPYAHRTPLPLTGCRVYVDVADPLPYLEQALLRKGGNTTALVAAGAFPGMSNVLGVEAVAQLDPQRTIQSLRFQYFTAGLGGSGPVNLFITNVGFGDPMTQYDGGVLRFFMELSGRLLGKVDFFLPQVPEHLQKANDRVRERVGTKQVFAWPFPEAATVPTILKDATDSFRWRRIDSSAAMGTAPDVWNTMLGVLVQLIPRAWWRKERFSHFLADFSQPLVSATDAWLKWKDPFANGETHAMRIDATLDDQSGISIVQAHDSFRQCVAQSCAEFAMDCLEYPDPGTVSLPEQRYADPVARQRIIEKLTTTPGTFCYTGPVSLQRIDGPTQLQEALEKAKQTER